MTKDQLHSVHCYSNIWIKENLKHWSILSFGCTRIFGCMADFSLALSLETRCKRSGQLFIWPSIIPL